MVATEARPDVEAPDTGREGRFARAPNNPADELVDEETRAVIATQYGFGDPEAFHDELVDQAAASQGRFKTDAEDAGYYLPPGSWVVCPPA